MDKENILYYQSNIKTSRDEDRVYAMKYANQQMLIDKLEQQCKKQKEVIDRILNETKETRNILNNNRDDNMLSKSCLLSYLGIVEDLLEEVSE